MLCNQEVLFLPIKFKSYFIDIPGKMANKLWSMSLEVKESRLKLYVWGLSKIQDNIMRPVPALLNFKRYHFLLVPQNNIHTDTVRIRTLEI